MRTATLLLLCLPLSVSAVDDAASQPNRSALVFLIAGQSNAVGVAAFSPETNVKSGMAKMHPTIPGSTAKEVGIPTTMDAYPRSYIWGKGFERLTPGKILKGGYKDPNRHGIELPILLEVKYPDANKFFIKHGPGGHNLHTQWAAGSGPDYQDFKEQIDAALADMKKRYKHVQIIGLYWDQGESGRYQKGWAGTSSSNRPAKGAMTSAASLKRCRNSTTPAHPLFQEPPAKSKFLAALIVLDYCRSKSVDGFKEIPRINPFF